MGNEPAPAAENELRAGRWLREPMVQSLASAGLLYLSFFPANWGWLGWIALVPILNVIMTAAPARVYWSVWISGMAFGLAALQWLRLASDPMYIFWVLLALLISLHFLFFAWFTRRLTVRAGIPLLLSAPAVWTFLEYVRAHLGIGFPWYYLGHTQHDVLVVAQAADVFGAYGLSFLVMMCNVMVWQACRFIARRAATTGANVGKSELLLVMAITMVFLVATTAYGFWRLQQTDFSPGPRVALLQGNMPQFIRNDDQEWRRIADHFGNLAQRAAALHPNLIVWSETSCYFDWRRIEPGCPPDAITSEWRDWHAESPLFFEAVMQNCQIPMLLGLNRYFLETDGQRRKYNTALLLDANAKPLCHYDKIYRIPFGEYIPWADTIPIMKWLSLYEAGYEYGIAPGKEHTSFPIPGTPYHFAALICYEDSVPHLAPAFLRGSAPPDFFVNISNDGWFRGSSEHEQHLVGARFRAIECRRPLARSVNVGISAVIDGNGRIVAMPGKTWADSKSVATVVEATIPLDRRSSLYVFWGDVLPWGCGIVALIGLVVSRVHRTVRL